MNHCAFCGADIAPYLVACEACVWKVAKEVSAEPVVEQKNPLSDSDKAQRREQEIAADVFNPNESDLDYFLRRKRHFGL